MDIIKPVWYLVHSYSCPEEYTETRKQFSEAPILVWACYRSHYEILNGGLHQYFWNSAGIVWYEAVKGCREMSMERTAQILFEAGSLFPHGTPPQDRDVRCDQLESIASGKLDSLTTNYFDLSEDIDRIALDYIRGRSADFFYEGEYTAQIGFRTVIELSGG